MNLNQRRRRRLHFHPCSALSGYWLSSPGSQEPECYTCGDLGCRLLEWLILRNGKIMVDMCAQKPCSLLTVSYNYVYSTIKAGTHLAGRVCKMFVIVRPDKFL